MRLGEVNSLWEAGSPKMSCAGAHFHQRNMFDLIISSKIYMYLEKMLHEIYQVLEENVLEI